MVYKVPPGDIFANNYGRGHMKPSHQVSYNMRLPPNKKIPVKNDQYIQGTPCKIALRNLVSLQNLVRNRDSGIFFAPYSVGIMYYYSLNQNWRCI